MEDREGGWGITLRWILSKKFFAMGSEQNWLSIVFSGEL
jgi:hypothetical protein